MAAQAQVFGRPPLVGCGRSWLFAAEGLIYWQYVNVGIVPVSQYDEYLQKADDCATKVFALNPESSKGHGLRGAIRHNRADANGAADDYKKALILDPNDPEALLWLGYHYAASGRPDLARAAFARAWSSALAITLSASRGAQPVRAIHELAGGRR